MVRRNGLLLLGVTRPLDHDDADDDVDAVDDGLAYADCGAD